MIIYLYEKLRSIHSTMAFGFDDITLYSKITHNISPESMLWTEVILRAIHDIRYYVTSTPKLREYFHIAQNAKLWLFSESQAPQSFVWCCSVALIHTPYEPSAFVKATRQQLPKNIPSPTNSHSNLQYEAIQRRYNMGKRSPLLR